MATPIKKKIEEKQTELRRHVFGDLDQRHIWDRKTAKGFTTIPRTMPLIGIIMDTLAGKGKPVSSTYLELWCHSNDAGFVTLSKQANIAYASGFSGLRGIATWKERLRKLEDLGFIGTRPGVSGNLHYVQIWNPYLVIKHHKESATEGFSSSAYNVLFERMLEIGAKDIEG